MRGKKPLGLELENVASLCANEEVARLGHLISRSECVLECKIQRFGCILRQAGLFRLESALPRFLECLIDVLYTCYFFETGMLTYERGYQT